MEVNYIDGFPEILRILWIFKWVCSHQHNIKSHSTWPHICQLNKHKANLNGNLKSKWHTYCTKRNRWNKIMAHSLAFFLSSQAGEEFNCLPSEVSHTWMGFVVTEANILLQKGKFLFIIQWLIWVFSFKKKIKICFYYIKFMGRTKQRITYDTNETNATRQ